VDDERYSNASLAELVREQEHIIRTRSADLIVARHSLEKARTQFLVLENYHTETQQDAIIDAEMSLRALSEYVRQLEDQIIAARSLIRAYRRARTDNLPWRRAFRWTQRLVKHARRAPTKPGRTELPPVDDR